MKKGIDIRTNPNERTQDYLIDLPLAIPCIDSNGPIPLSFLWPRNSEDTL